MENTINKTLKLPTELVQATEKIIQAGKVKNFEEFVILALRHELSSLNKADNKTSLNLPKSPVESSEDPIWELGENPVLGDVTNASENLDQYLYNSL